jgi:hypothetical protein
MQEIPEWKKIESNALWILIKIAPILLQSYTFSNFFHFHENSSRSQKMWNSSETGAENLINHIVCSREKGVLDVSRWKHITTETWYHEMKYMPLKFTFLLTKACKEIFIQVFSSRAITFPHEHTHLLSRVLPTEIIKARRRRKRNAARLGHFCVDLITFYHRRPSTSLI